MMQEKRESFDDLAKSLLNNLEEKPTADNWENIQAGLNDEMTDQLFQSLKDIEVPPPPHNWQKIQRELPLHVVYRRPLLFIGRAAAILLFALCLPPLLKYYHTTPPIVGVDAVEQKSPTTPTFGEVVEKAIQEKAATNTVTFHKKKKIPTPTEAELLLSALLADDQEFPDSLLDIHRLQNMLKPIEPLPVISAVARIESLPLTNLNLKSNRVSTTELEISVPLIFVEEGEAEQLIELYEKLH